MDGLVQTLRLSGWRLCQGYSIRPRAQPQWRSVKLYIPECSKCLPDICLNASGNKIAHDVAFLDSCCQLWDINLNSWTPGTKKHETCRGCILRRWWWWPQSVDSRAATEWPLAQAPTRIFRWSYGGDERRSPKLVQNEAMKRILLGGLTGLGTPKGWSKELLREYRRQKKCQSSPILLMSSSVQNKSNLMT